MLRKPATGYNASMPTPHLIIELEREDDGRWIADLPVLPGVMAYGNTQDEAVARVQILALRVLADRIEHGEPVPEVQSVFTVAT
jgi:predicted RNase H-like HicB family nuclease